MAAGITAAFFTVHFGMFTVVLGVFSFILANQAGVGAISLAGAGWLLVRAVAANVPGVVADARYVATDGYSQLAARTQAVMGRPYLRMIPLHLGVVVLFGAQWQATTVPLEWGIVGVVVLMTAASSLWRYPELDPGSTARVT